MQLSAPPQIPLSHDIRSAEILASVRQTFVDKGFDGASMQDLARAAGMSVGNFYRYFPSKAAIIQAMILRDAVEVRQDFARILASEDPMRTLRQVIAEHVESTDCQKDSTLWAEIEAASRRSPEIAEAANRMAEEVKSHLRAVFAQGTGLTEEEASRRFSGTAAFVFTMIKAASCLSGVTPLDQTEVRAMIMQTIDQTLDQITALTTARA